MGPSITANATSNYVTLGVGDEIFAVDVAIVREILAYRTVVHLPNAPRFWWASSMCGGTPCR